MDYEAGVFVALALWAALAVSRLVALNSVMARNLRKIGQRVSLSTLQAAKIGRPEDSSAARTAAKFLALTLAGLPLALLSWLYVAWAVFSFTHARFKDAGAPDAVKEFRWKLRNIDMSFDDLVRELMKVSGDPPEKFDTVRAEVIAVLEQQRRGE